MKTYKNPLTLDGRLKPSVHVSEKKVAAVQALFERHLQGDLIATATLTEALTTSDAIFNMAHLTNLNFLPQYDEETQNASWRTVAGERTVPDLRPVSLYDLQFRSFGDSDNATGVLSEHGAAPRIPEGTPYPFAYLSAEQAQQGARVHKRGFKTDWTLEARINDGLGALDRLPQDMLQVAIDTEEAEVWLALRAAIEANREQIDLQGGVVLGPEGEKTVTPNSPFSLDAVVRAKAELKNRLFNGRKLQFRGRLNLLVPVGKSDEIAWLANRTLGAVTVGNNSDTAYTYSVGSLGSIYNPLGDIDIIETDWFGDTNADEWALMPKPGATRRPVVEHLNLRGYTAPQLFVADVAGSAVGGGAISPFEGSFDADVITLKMRQFGGAVVWDNAKAVLYSDGTGTD